MSKQDKVTKLVVGLAALAILFLGLREMYYGRKSASWPTAEGEITASNLEQHHFRVKSRPRTLVTASVKYEYHVGGHPYTANRVSFGQQDGGFATAAEEVVAHYPVGSRVTVHYNPSAPDVAVLETGVPALAILLIGIGGTGLAFLVFGSWLGSGSEAPLQIGAQNPRAGHPA